MAFRRRVNTAKLGIKSLRQLRQNPYETAFGELYAHSKL